MTATAKLAAFAAALGVLFAAGAAAGRLADPSPPRGHAPAREDADATHPATPLPVRGLAVATDALRLVVERPERRRGRREQLRFRVVDRRGETVRDFDVEHTKRMHLIVVRRDLAGFQHLHPVQEADGAWATPLRLRDAGSYRLFADFSRAGTPVTLASDLRVDGSADLAPLPPPAPVAPAGGGYEVRLGGGRPRAGREAQLRFTVTRGGAPVAVQPYLGASGHLVALREGDLAFLHVHPSVHGAGVAFEATFPTAGRYRLFLQFKHAGRVRTTAFTREVD